MRDLVLFPQMILSIFVGRPDTQRAVEFALAGDRRVLVVAQRRDIDNDPNTLESLYPVGVTASVINRQTQVDGVLKVSISGLQRTAIVRLLNDELPGGGGRADRGRRAAGQPRPSPCRAPFSRRISSTPTSISPRLPPGPRARHGLPSIGDPGLLADTVAPLLSVGIDSKQQLLETGDVVSRLEMIFDLMKAGRPANP